MIQTNIFNDPSLNQPNADFFIGSNFNPINGQPDMGEGTDGKMGLGSAPNVVSLTENELLYDNPSRKSKSFTNDRF